MSKHSSRRVHNVRRYNDLKLNSLVRRGHRFEFFRVGQDVCWRCGKTKAEH